MMMAASLSFWATSAFFTVLLVLALLLPWLISLTKCASFSDFTSSSICLFKCKQSFVLCPLSLWKSQYLFLFLDSSAPAIGGGVVKVHFLASIASISLGVFVSGVKRSPLLLLRQNVYTNHSKNFPNAEQGLVSNTIYDNMKLSWRGRAKSNILLNNLCEVLNRQLLDGRDKPIITSLEYIREYLMKRIVMSKGKTRKWELSGIPYTHAVASIWDQANNGIDTEIPESYCLPVHWLTTWKEMYKFKINPVNRPHGWKKSDVPTTIIPPKPNPQIGKPPKKRKKSAAELADEMMKSKKLTKTGKSVTCKLCKQVGHNSRGCKSKKGGGSQQAGVAGHGDAAHGSQQANYSCSQTTQSTPQAS
ncbi:mutator type transposase [Tanacetum coccineum]